MAIEILMPALSPTMEEGTLSKWMVGEGDQVSSGDILAEIETDKATMEFEAVDEGIIGKILISEGTSGILVNSTIAVLLEEGETIEDVHLPQKTVVVATKGFETEAEPVSNPQSFPVVEPNVPVGTNYKSQTVREAIREAM